MSQHLLEPRKGDRVMIERPMPTRIAWSHGTVTRIESGQGLRVYVRLDGEDRDRMYGCARDKIVVTESAPPTTPTEEGR